MRASEIQKQFLVPKLTNEKFVEFYNMIWKPLKQFNDDIFAKNFVKYKCMLWKYLCDRYVAKKITSLAKTNREIYGWIDDALTLNINGKYFENLMENVYMEIADDRLIDNPKVLHFFYRGVGYRGSIRLRIEVIFKDNEQIIIFNAHDYDDYAGKSIILYNSEKYTNYTIMSYIKLVNSFNIQSVNGSKMANLDESVIYKINGNLFDETELDILHKMYDVTTFWSLTKKWYNIETTRYIPEMLKNNIFAIGVDQGKWLDIGIKYPFLYVGMCDQFANVNASVSINDFYKQYYCHLDMSLLYIIFSVFNRYESIMTTTDRIFPVLNCFNLPCSEVDLMLANTSFLEHEWREEY